MLNDIFIKLAEQFQTIREQFIAYVPQLIAGLLVGVLLLVCVRLVRRWAQGLARRVEGPLELERLIVNSIYIFSLLIGITITLSIFGVNVMGMIAGLGLSGLAIGFALKDIIENVLAGALILVQRPFAIGEAIELEAIVGIVTDIQIRSTTLRTFDNVEIVIPNRTVYTATIKNYSTYPVRRRQVSLRLGYGEDLGEATQALMDRLKSIDGVADDPAPFITLDDFGDSAVSGTVFYYIDTKKFDFGGTHTQVLKALQEVTKERHIAHPYPTRVVINR
ncbi:MAG: mechanosensitive ion channel family protein [Anaerolineae bacterium]|nr:mechanosensitive ion channel family protein [Anaerolineae bacterium]